MTSPLVTIVIAAYKTPRDYLSAALSSALDQSYTEIEIIVSDDSPTPSLRAVVEQLGDPRVEYRHNSPPCGVAKNHWSCFQNARGEFIAVLNHDDLYSPNFLERLVAHLVADPQLSLVFCDHWVIDQNGCFMVEETERVSEYWGRKQLREGAYKPFYQLFAAQTIPMVMGTVFRKSILPPSLPENAGPAYDLWLTYLLCREGLGAYYVRDRLSSWRAHAGNLTSRRGYDWATGCAACWQAVTCDPNLSSIHRTAQRKAATALYSSAVSSWLAGQRLNCVRHGWQSLRMRPSWKGVIACALSLIPRWLVNQTKAYK